MNDTRQTNIVMMPTTKKRLKRLAVELDLTMGATISLLLDKVAPVSGDELARMICEDYVK